ncbi:MAG: DinB family protein [Chloroflexi bacterium]|nr:DinB family protein [Chloroflexota bacterium]
MRYVRQAGSDPSFLLKALGEASGEFRREFHGLRYRDLLVPAPAPDDGWTMLGLAVHVREVEAGVVDQVRTLLHRRNAEIRAVDLDDVPLLEDYDGEDAEEVLEDYHDLRQRLTYSLWDVDADDWYREGIHPYRGPVKLLDLTRELYQHDLEHLWQARRMVLALAESAR